MLRSIMQIYVKNSKEAMIFYQKAFGATISNIHKNDDGSYMHVEMNLFGQILALSETLDANSFSGNTMQLCLHFTESEKEIISNAYNVLKENAEIKFPLGPCFYSPYMFGLIDKFGVNWCLFY